MAHPFYVRARLILDMIVCLLSAVLGGGRGAGAESDGTLASQSALDAVQGAFREPPQRLKRPVAGLTVSAAWHHCSAKGAGGKVTIGRCPGAPRSTARPAPMPLDVQLMSLCEAVGDSVQASAAKFGDEDVHGWRIAPIGVGAWSRVQPSAGGGREATTVGGGQPPTDSFREATTEGGGQPSAVGSREATTVGGGQPSAVGSREATTARRRSTVAGSCGQSATRCSRQAPAWAGVAVPRPRVPGHGAQ
jgi:hypothetical protein